MQHLIDAEVVLHTGLKTELGYLSSWSHAGCGEMSVGRQCQPETQHEERWPGRGSFPALQVRVRASLQSASSLLPGRTGERERLAYVLSNLRLLP